MIEKIHKPDLKELEIAVELLKEEYSIDTDISARAIKVLGLLNKQNRLPDSIFCHNSKSIVLNWSNVAHNLYFTVSKTHVSILVSMFRRVGSKIKERTTVSFEDLENEEIIGSIFHVFENTV